MSLTVVPDQAAAGLAAYDVRLAAPTVAATPVASSSSGSSSGSGSGSFDFGSSGSGSDDSSGSGSSSDFASGGSSDSSSGSSGSSGSFDSGSGFAGGGAASAFGSTTPKPDAPTDDAATTTPAADDAGLDGTGSVTDDELALTPVLPAGSSVDDQKTVGKALTYIVLSALAGVAVGGGSRLNRRRALA